MDQDILYHLALGSGSHDLVEMFGDVKVRFAISVTIETVYCSSILRRDFEEFVFVCLYSNDNQKTKIIKFVVAVCLHGWHTEADGEFCSLHNE